MAYRAASSNKGRISRVEDMTGTVFDQRRMPALPKGLAAEIRKRARLVFQSHPHLMCPTQVEPVVRLAKLRARFDELEAIVARDGGIIENSRGTLMEHPAALGMRSTATAILATEKALGIVFVAKNSNVRAAEERPLAKALEPGTRASGGKGPRLQLA